LLITVVHTTMPGNPPPEETCNVKKAKTLLGWAPKALPERMLELRTPRI
jgi:hypothetical protein